MSFLSNVGKVNGLQNKLSIVPPPGLFFPPPHTRVHHSSFIYLFILPPPLWKILLYARKSLTCFLSRPLLTRLLSILCQTSDLKIDPVWSCRFPFKSTPTAWGWRWGGRGRRGGAVTGKSREAPRLHQDRLWGRKVSNAGGKGVLYLTVLFKIYTLLLACQPKSWRAVFSGPEGELAILNPQLNIEQLVEFLLSDPNSNGN